MDIGGTYSSSSMSSADRREGQVGGSKLVRIRRRREREDSRTKNQRRKKRRNNKGRGSEIQRRHTRVRYHVPMTWHTRYTRREHRHSQPMRNLTAFDFERGVRGGGREVKVCSAQGGTHLFPFVQYTRRPVVGQQCSYFPGLA